MKTKKQLEKLSAKIGEAIRNYHEAIAENLRELGHPVTVQDQSQEYDRGITLDILWDNSSNTGRYDQIRCEKNNYIEVHCFSWNHVPTDEWVGLGMLGDAAGYLLEAIHWIDADKLMRVDGGVWSGTANEIYSFSDSVSLYFVHENGRIEDVMWRKIIDEFDGVRGYFAVEKDLYDLAIQEIEDHYKESREQFNLALK